MGEWRTSTTPGLRGEGFQRVVDLDLLDLLSPPVLLVLPPGPDSETTGSRLGGTEGCVVTPATPSTVLTTLATTGGPDRVSPPVQTRQRGSFTET